MIDNLFTFVRTLGNQRIEGKKFFTTQIGVLGALSDGNSSLGTSGYVLSSTGTGVEWVPAATSSVEALDDLSDVVISTASNGQLLRFNGTNWVNWTPNFLTSYGSLDNLSDVVITTPSSGQLLRYGIPPGSGESLPIWYNFTPNYLTPSSSIDNLSDVTITSATTGQLLQWNGSAWVNATLSTVEYVSKVQHLVKCGVAVSKGQAVYVTSADGTNMIVGLASNVSEPTSSKVIGLAASNGAINDQIFVVTEGLIAGLNTSTATAGDPVWLGTNGNLIFGLTNKPVAPAHLVYLGVVTRVQQNNGEIFVNVQNGFELHELHDVLISSPSAGQLVRRDSDGLWKNWTPNYLTSFTETDPVFEASPAAGISTEDIGFWNEAYSWGNHALAGYLTSFTETDPIFIASAAAGITATNISNWNTAYGWGNHATQGYATQSWVGLNYYNEGEIDDFFSGAEPISGYNKSNWDTAYGWGNHASAGYLTSYTETDTLNSVTGRGNTTSNSVTIGGLRLNNTGVIAYSGYAGLEYHNTYGTWEGYIGTETGTGNLRYNSRLGTHNWYSNSVFKMSLNTYGLGIGRDAASNEKIAVNTFDGVWALDVYNNGSQVGGIHVNDSIITIQDANNNGIKLATGGNVYWNSNIVATRAWVQAQGYLTSDTDAQTLSYDQGAKQITISNGNSITLDNLATEDYVTSQGYVTASHTHAASAIVSGTISTDRLPKQELGISIQGNFGQWEPHGTYTNINTDVAYWGWSFVQGNTNAPHSGSSQWYRGRFSLGDAYGNGSAGGDYWMEIAIPRYNQNSNSGNLFVRSCENGVINAWQGVRAAFATDADTLDGQHGSYYQPASTAITTSNIGSQSVNYAASSGNSDTLDGIDSSRFIYGQSGNRRGTNLISNWNQTDFPDVAFLSAEAGGTNAPTGDYTYGTQYSFHRDGAAYRTQLVTALYSDTSIYVRNSRDSDVWNSWKRLWHSGDFSSTNISNWNTAYGWGNHAIAGYAAASSLSNYLPLTGGTISGSIIVNSGAGYPVQVSSGQRYMLQIRNTANTVNSGYGWWLATDTNFNFALHADGAADRLTLTRDGNLTVSGSVTASGGNSTQWNTAYGWGNHADAPYWNVSLNQDIQVEANNVTFVGNVTIQGTLTESSSIRFKENIQPLEPALAKVEQLNPVTYTKISTQEEEIGLIAEEVAELFQEVVTYNEEGQPQGVSYSRLSVILLKALQEQNAVIAALTERVNKLENK